MNKIDELKNQYLQLAHAMQSGVAAMMDVDDNATRAKHLRVGVNSAMVETSTIATLLVKKGVITEEEWFEGLIEMMRKEVLMYEKRLSEKFGNVIKLG